MSTYLRCPNCGEEKFFIEYPEEGLIFFHLDGNGGVIPTKKGRWVPPIEDLETINCISCSWDGSVSDLN